jgi:hypothetical protein
MVIEAVQQAAVRRECPREIVQSETILNALNMLTLRRLVSEDEGRYAPVAEEVELLTHYADSIAHWLPEDQKAQ